jgi:hypothetical protein
MSEVILLYLNDVQGKSLLVKKKIDHFMIKYEGNSNQVTGIHNM